MDIQDIGIEADGDLIFVTVAKYKLFLSYGNVGLDAYVLYSHLMFTARLQKTNSVKAKDIYLRGGLKWSKDRLLKAKKLLFQLELIKGNQNRQDDGTFGESYIEVSTQSTPFEIKEILPQSSKPEAGSTGVRVETTNALTKKKNALTKKVNINGRKKNDPFVFNFLKSHFKEINPDYHHDGKQAKAITNLILWAKNDVQKIVSLVSKFLDIKDRDNSSFWYNSPATPASVYSKRDNILAYQLDGKEFKPLDASTIKI